MIGIVAAVPNCSVEHQKSALAFSLDVNKENAKTLNLTHIGDLGSLNTGGIAMAFEQMVNEIEHANEGQRLRFDFSHVKNGGAGFAAMLIQLAGIAKKNQVNVSFTGVNRQVLRVLSSCRVTDLLLFTCR